MKKFLVWALLFFGATSLACHEVIAAEVLVIDAWATATAPGQTTGAVYLVLKSDVDAKLVGVASAVAAKIKLHEMRMDGGMMIMRDRASIDLPAGKTVDFKNAGYHVMLVDLAKPLKPGDKIWLTLTIEDANKKRSTLTSEVAVRALNDAGAMQMHHPQ